MCGICGVIDLNSEGRALLDDVRVMCDAIAHRGPDGDGFYASPDGRAALGMRRLSIIDTAGSDQPLYNEDKSIALVFNGEIYNYRELRADLIARGHTFHTDGDGETLIHLYEEYGIDSIYERDNMFARLRGMYAFALYDTWRGRLLLAVDHIGMKPLYLWQHDGALHFASEIKAFMTDADAPHALNLRTLDTYMSFGYMIGDETLFAGIHRLMPGHYLITERPTYHIREHWRFGGDYTPPLPKDEGERITATRAMLSESVRLHLESDVPLGLFLSGGVDSAAVLALMHQHGASPVRTFTVGYAGSTPDNELAAARRIAAHFGAQHSERVITADDWWGAFDRYVYHHDEPNANPSAISLMLLAEETAKHVKVVLTGLGGDELFSGYANHRLIRWTLNAHQRWGKYAAPLGTLIDGMEPYYPAMKRWRGVGALPTYLPRLRLPTLPLNDALLRIQSFDGLVMSGALRDRLYSDRLKASAAKYRYKERTFARIFDDSKWSDNHRDDMTSPVDIAQALVINTWLHGNALLNADKVTMAHSLEARVPFFDRALLEAMAYTPPEDPAKGNKYLLREAMRPLLPAFALERPKQPFGTPILGWFRHELADRIQSVLRDRGAFVRGYFDGAALDRLLDDHFSGRAPQVEVVFRLLILERWAATFAIQK